MKINYGFLFGITLFLISCSTVIKEAGNWIEKSNSSTSNYLTGNYFSLEKNTVKTFLPEGFKRYTIEQYRVALDSSIAKNSISNEIRRLENMRDIKGSFGLFFDPDSGSTYTINTLPYINFNRNDAKSLLSIIKQNNDKLSLMTDLNFKKLTATYSKNKNFTMFRSIFQIDNFKTDMRGFGTFYIVSANKQTFLINLTTPVQVNFDRYLEKMKF